jgi:hypothetical protein
MIPGPRVEFLMPASCCYCGCALPAVKASWPRHDYEHCLATVGVPRTHGACTLCVQKQLAGLEVHDVLATARVEAKPAPTFPPHVCVPAGMTAEEWISSIDQGGK